MMVFIQCPACRRRHPEGSCPRYDLTEAEIADRETADAMVDVLIRIGPLAADAKRKVLLMVSGYFDLGLTKPPA